MSPSKDERRQMVLGVLATHGQVQWHTRGADIAFADDVLELEELRLAIEAAAAAYTAEWWSFIRRHRSRLVTRNKQRRNW